MKLIYIANTRVPSEKANSVQSMKMCQSFSNFFTTVEFWTGKSRNIKKMKSVENIYDFYGVQDKFKIKKIFQYDSFILGHTNEFLWSNIRGLIFALNVLLKLRKNLYKDAIVYTRSWYVLLILKTFTRRKVFFEAHKYSPKIINILQRCDGLIVINNFLLNRYSSHDFKKIIKLHDAVDIEEFSSISNYSRKNPSDKFNILYFGSLYPHKGVETVIDALTFLPENFYFTCIGGEGAYFEKLVDYVKEKKLSHRVTLSNFIPKKQLLKYIDRADFLVIPNSNKYEENLGTSPLKLFEYMASRRIIISSRIDAITEVLSTEEAFFFVPDDSLSLANQIIAASLVDSSNKIRKSFKKAQKYSWDNRAREIFNFIV